MRITFDRTKDATNQALHGVPLALASELVWDEMIAMLDTRKDYGEARMIGYAPLGNRLFCVVFVDRGDARRIISLRKANSREVKAYESET